MEIVCGNLEGFVCAVWHIFYVRLLGVVSLDVVLGNYCGAFLTLSKSSIRSGKSCKPKSVALSV